MTKKEAALFLGMSERTLERYTSHNRIGVRYEKGKTFDVAVYDRGELERFKTELERPTHRPAVQRMSDQNGSATNNDNHDSTALSPLASFDAIERLVTATAQATIQAMVSSAPAQPERPSVAVADKLLLTRAEAMSYTGASENAIKAAITQGKLTAHKGFGRGQKFKRADLDKWIAKL
jgi:excisionase family DNA binding protein